MKGKHVWGLLGAYMAVGVGVAIWSHNRIKDGNPTFDGYGDPPPVPDLQRVLLWPAAVYYNLK